VADENAAKFINAARRRGGVAARGALAQPTMPLIGFLGPASPGPYAPYVAGFLRGLKEVGHVDGENVAIEYRWARTRTIGYRRWRPSWCTDRSA